MQNICYVVSGIDKALAFEWICEYLDKSKYNLSFVLLHNSKGGLENYLEAQQILYTRIPYKTKADILKATYHCISFFKQNRIEIVHCHLLDAGIAGITAAWLAGIKSRIYTRHYSSYHHVYFPKGIWYDKIINKLSTKIIAVSQVVKNILTEKENVDPKKISVIHHGFPLDEFDKATFESVSAMKRKYQINNACPVIGLVSRYTEWKGLQYAISAFKEVLNSFPNAHLVLANAKGSYQPHIKKLLTEIPTQNFTEIAFESDLFTLFKLFDVFVHVPVDEHSEAFGQVYVEAMASGIPCIFTISGIAGEIAINGKNCLVVPHKNSQAIQKRIIDILNNPEAGKMLGKEAKISVENNFELGTMIRRLGEIYG